jgi:hypothetical protein
VTRKSLPEERNKPREGKALNFLACHLDGTASINHPEVGNILRHGAQRSPRSGYFGGARAQGTRKETREDKYRRWSGGGGGDGGRGRGRGEGVEDSR